ncbi:thioredoxin [Schlesneria paludicola]|uniref:thioredoxin n=1 Tax=Schlesneria paludicola TaxID=360056 RepID=UPI00029B2CE6|nr:thioredoxin [Schlesneria paludicola]
MSTILGFLGDLLPFLLVMLAVSSTCIWLATCIAVVLGRRGSAAIRHRLWGLSMVAVLVAPILISTLPTPRWTTWNLPSIPAGSPSSILNRIVPNEAPDAEQSERSERRSAVDSVGPNAASRILVDDGHDVSMQSDAANPPRLDKVGTSITTKPERERAQASSVSITNRGAWQILSRRALLTVACWIWLAGAAVSGILLAVSLRHVSRWLRNAIPLEVGREVDLCCELCRHLSIASPIQMVISPETLVPFVTGLRRPVLVLPTGSGQWTTERLKVVIAHELMHVRRGDVLWQLIGRVCLIPTWFHPLGWYAMSRLRIECEHACDDAVLLSGELPCDYASHLVEIAAGLRRSAQLLPTHVVAMAKHSLVEARVRSILDSQRRRHPVSHPRAWCFALGMFAAIVLIVTILPGRSESKPPNSDHSQVVAQNTLPPLPPMAIGGGKPQAEGRPSRIDEALDEPISREFPEGVSFTEILTSLVEGYQIPIRFDEMSFMRSRIEWSHLPGYVGKGVKLRDLLNEILTPLLPVDDGALDLHDSHGVLVVASKRAQNSPDIPRESVVLTTITGSVHDQNGHPISKARIEIRSGYQSTFMLSDGEGCFRVRTEFNAPYGLSILATDPATQHQVSWRFAPSWNPPAKTVPVAELVVKPLKKVIVEVVDEADSPVVGATVGASFDSRSSALVAHSDAEGKVEFSLTEGKLVGHIFAAARGKGVDYISYLDTRAYSEPDRKQPEQPEGHVRLKLTGARTITLNVRDEDGQPVSGVQFYPWLLRKPGDPLAELNLSMFQNFGRETTNQEGVAVFDWMPNETTGKGLTQFWHDSRKHIRRRVIHDPKKSPDGKLDVILQKPVMITGKVTSEDGQPVIGATISATGADYFHDQCRVSAKSGPDGSYTLSVFPHQIYLLVATTADQTLKGARDGILVYPGKPLTEMNLELKPSTRVFGRVTIGPNAQPVKGQQIQFYQYGKDLHQFQDAAFPNPDNENTWVCPMTVHATTTDADGQYEMQLSTGQFDIRGPEQHKVAKFEIKDRTPHEFNFHSERPDKGSYRGRVVTGESETPVENATVEIVAHSEFGRSIGATTDSDGRFHLTRGLFRSAFYARNKDRSLAGLIEIGPDDMEGTIKISPTATYSARILDHQGQPLPVGSKIQYGVHVHMGEKNAPFMTSYGGHGITREDGRVTFSGMVVGAKYHLSLEAENGRSWQGITEIIPKSSEPKDLGDLLLKPPVEPYKPPTLEQRIETAFQKPQSGTERYHSALVDAKLSHQHILVVFADPNRPATKSLYVAYYDDNEVRKLTHEFRAIAVPLTDEKLEAAQELATNLDLKLPVDGSPLLLIANDQGEVLGTARGDELSTGDPAVVDSAKLHAFLQRHVPSKVDAKQLLTDALEQAQRENKRVIVQQTATWCGPCWSLSRFLNKHRSIWEKDYIWIKMDERWQDVALVMKPIRKSAEGGIPWTAILDADGNVLVNSNQADGQNMGFPSASEPEGIEHFLMMLKSTAQRMNDEDLETLKVDLSKK